MAKEKDAVMRAWIEGVLTDLLLKTVAKNVYLDGTTTVYDKIGQLVEAVNLRAKSADVTRQIQQAMQDVKEEIEMQTPADGLTPHIGDNGNWFLGTVDTGVQAQGRDGDPGDNGIGIQSITQTTTSTADGGENVWTVTLSNGATAVFQVKNGSKGSTGNDGKDGAPGTPGKDGNPGTPGADGVTPSFTVGSTTTLSPGSNATVTLGGTKENPVLSFGIPRGRDGQGGTGSGAAGEDGGFYVISVSQPDENTMRLSFTPSKTDMPGIGSIDIALPSGPAGNPGTPGADGVGIASIAKTSTSNADGGINVFTVTLDNGQTADFQVQNGSKGSTGSPGKDGNPGNPGADGVGIQSITQTTTSTADGGENVWTVKLSNGSTGTFRVKNGSKGSAGKTPEKGVDYFTETEKQAIAAQAAGLVDLSVAVGEHIQAYEVTIGTRWTGSRAPYTQTVSVPGIKSTDNPIVGYAVSTSTATAEAESAAILSVYSFETLNGQIKAYATSKTTTQFKIVLVVIR